MITRTCIASVIIVCSACQTAEPDPLATSDLAEARALITAGEKWKAWSLLQDFEEEEFDRFTRAEYSQLAGDLAYENGDFNLAIQYYEKALLAGIAANNSRTTEARLFEMGCAYMDGDVRILGIFPDSNRGIVTLQNLHAWAPESPYAPECLARVASFAFENGRFAEASADYQTILRFYPDSEWADIAHFRIGMCGLERIKGPDSDPKLISQAINQLQAYLEGAPSGLHREEAKNGIARLEELSAQHEIKIGDYYLTIGNVEGARIHFEEAAGRQGTAAAEIANLRLTGLLSTSDLPVNEQ